MRGQRDWWRAVAPNRAGASLAAGRRRVRVSSFCTDSEAHIQAKRGAEIDAQDELAAVAAKKELAAAQAQAQRSATLRGQPTPPPRTKAKSTVAPADAPRHQLNRYPDARMRGLRG